MYSDLSKHSLSVGILKNCELQKEKQIGTALCIQETNQPSYFKLKIWQYPSDDFYLVKNHSNEKYTVFSKIEYDDYESGPHFTRPIGRGYQNSDLPGFIQVQFNFPWERCFLSLFPED